MLPESVNSRLDRGVDGGRRPVKIRMKFSTVTYKFIKVITQVSLKINTFPCLVSSVIDFDVITVHIDLLIGVVVNGGRVGIPGVAGHVVGNHQNDLAVGYPQAFDTAVNAQNVGYMSVIEPEPGSIYQNSPIARVMTRSEKLLGFGLLQINNRFFVVCKSILLHGLNRD